MYCVLTFTAPHFRPVVNSAEINQETKGVWNHHKYLKGHHSITGWAGVFELNKLYISPLSAILDLIHTLSEVKYLFHYLRIFFCVKVRSKIRLRLPSLKILYSFSAGINFIPQNLTSTFDPALKRLKYNRSHIYAPSSTGVNCEVIVWVNV